MTMTGYFEDLPTLIAEFDHEVFDDEIPPANWAEMIEFLDDRADIDYLDSEGIEESYQEALDSEGTVLIGGLEYYPSHILKEIDPIAYRCGLADYSDSLSADYLVLDF